jgi:hypothetical protein
MVTLTESTMTMEILGCLPLLSSPYSRLCARVHRLFQVYLFEALLATLEERLLNLRVPLRRLPLRRLLEHVVIEEVNGVIDPLSLRKAWRLLKSTLRV